MLVTTGRFLSTACAAQIPANDAFQHETARVLFDSDPHALAWIKGEAMPEDLVGAILHALGLEFDTYDEKDC